MYIHTYSMAWSVSTKANKKYSNKVLQSKLLWIQRIRLLRIRNPDIQTADILINYLYLKKRILGKSALSLFITLKQTVKECTGKRFTSQVKKRPVAYLHIQPNIRPFLKSDFRQDIRLLYLVHRPDTGYKKCRIVLNFKTHPPNRPDSLR